MLATLNPSRIHQAFIISVGRVGEAQPRKAWKFKSLNDLTKACDQRAALISESLGEPRYATSVSLSWECRPYKNNARAECRARARRGAAGSSSKSAYSVNHRAHARACVRACEQRSRATTAGCAFKRTTTRHARLSLVFHASPLAGRPSPRSDIDHRSRASARYLTRADVPPRLDYTILQL